MQPEYPDFYQKQPNNGTLPEPITADDETDLAKHLKKPAITNFAHLAGHLPSSQIDEGRRRQSSNFFDILTDP